MARNGCTAISAGTGHVVLNSSRKSAIGVTRSTLAEINMRTLHRECAEGASRIPLVEVMLCTVS